MMTTLGPRAGGVGSSTQGYLLAIGTAALSGSAITIGKIVLQDARSLDLTMVCFALASVGNYIWARAIGLDLAGELSSKEAWKIILVQGVLSFGGVWAYWEGVRFLDPAVASFLNRAETLITVMLGMAVFGERFSLREGLGAALAISGIIVMKYSANVGFSKGFFFILASAAALGVSEILAKKAVRKTHPMAFALARNSFVALQCLLVFLIAGDSLVPQLGSRWYLVFLVALFGPLGARSLYLFALRLIDVAKAAIINQWQPVYVALLAYILIGTVPTARQWFGGALIIAGCSILIAGSRRKEKEIIGAVGPQPR